MSSGAQIISQKFFYNSGHPSYQVNLEEDICGLEITYLGWADYQGWEDKPVTHYYGFLEDINSGNLKGFPEDKAEPLQGFHFSGNLKGQFPFGWLKKRYEILKKSQLVI